MHKYLDFQEGIWLLKIIWNVIGNETSLIIFIFTEFV